NGHRFNQHEVLVNHPNAKRDCIMRRSNFVNLIVDQDLATVWSVETISDAHRRRLPRSILANTGMYRSRLHDNVYIVVGQNRSEAFCDVTEFEHAGQWSVVR